MTAGYRVPHPLIDFHDAKSVTGQPSRKRGCGSRTEANRSPPIGGFLTASSTPMVIRLPQTQTRYRYPNGRAQLSYATAGGSSCYLKHAAIFGQHRRE